MTLNRVILQNYQQRLISQIVCLHMNKMSSPRFTHTRARSGIIIKCIKARPLSRSRISNVKISTVYISQRTYSRPRQSHSYARVSAETRCVCAADSSGSERERREINTNSHLPLSCSLGNSYYTRTLRVLPYICYTPSCH